MGRLVIVCVIDHKGVGRLVIVCGFTLLRVILTSLTLMRFNVLKKLRKIKITVKITRCDLLLLLIKSTIYYHIRKHSEGEESKTEAKKNLSADGVFFFFLHQRLLFLKCSFFFFFEYRILTCSLIIRHEWFFILFF